MRGILMIEPLYHQVIAGNKTMTRRSGGLEVVNTEMDFLGETWSPSDWELCESEINVFEFFNKKRQEWAQCKPRYKVGEVLYLKEPTALVTLLKGSTPVRLYQYGMAPQEKHCIKWSNKLFMPAEAARAFIRITDIKCERLLDISVEDCIAEGIERAHSLIFPNKVLFKKYFKDDFTFTPSAKESFISLFRFANKMSPKQETGNLWAWAYSFIYLPDYKI